MSEALNLATFDEFPSHLDEGLLNRLANDIGRKLYTSEEIAARYGLNMGQLRSLLRRPDMLRRARRARALFESDEGLPDLLTFQAQVIVKEHMAGMASILTDPKATPAQKNETYRNFMRIGKVDGVGPDKGERSTSAPVSINFKFVHAGHTETFTASAPPEPVTLEADQDVGPV